MQIVINIPERDFEFICTYGQCNINKLMSIVGHGIPLPKDHGRLIDADAIIDTLGCSDREGYDCQTWNRIEIGDIIEDAPTIVPANKGE